MISPKAMMMLVSENSYGVLELKNSASPSGPPPPAAFCREKYPRLILSPPWLAESGDAQQPRSLKPQRRHDVGRRRLPFLRRAAFGDGAQFARENLSPENDASV